MIAHEIRNLLTPVRIAAQSALESPENIEEMIKALERAARACDHVSAITDALLVKSSLVCIATPISEIIEDVLSICPASPDACDIDASLSSHDLIIDTSADAVRHILLNLISNSLRATNHQPHSVRLGASCSTGNNHTGRFGEVTIWIEDDGPGLPDEIIKKFQQLSTSSQRGESLATARSGQSRGVGLEVASRLAQAVDATLLAQNLPGQGARIAVSFPRVSNKLADAA